MNERFKASREDFASQGAHLAHYECSYALVPLVSECECELGQDHVVTEAELYNALLLEARLAIADAWNRIGRWVSTALNRHKARRRSQSLLLTQRTSDDIVLAEIEAVEWPNHRLRSGRTRVSSDRHTG
ncbi:hypothetical protein [Curtobacterium flaccumfaciens]|uniref:hypothetical protein n=1 Tax=Curtobacterium flaccumfaciens TaxID=2035 RepID=UPI001E55353E|nr:hypothetical protein [Curtobacterium allii]MCE0459766.1 hypothetical protein [Curtobacterium allii]